MSGFSAQSSFTLRVSQSLSSRSVTMLTTFADASVSASTKSATIYDRLPSPVS